MTSLHQSAAISNSCRATAAGKGYTDEKGSSRIELDRARAKKARIDADKAEGSVIKITDAQAVFNEIAVTYATQLDGLGGRLAGQLSGMTDTAAIRLLILNETRNIRATAADRFRRLAALGHGGADHGTAAKPKRRSVGKSKPRAAAGKRGTGTVAKRKNAVHDPDTSGR